MKKIAGAPRYITEALLATCDTKECDNTYVMRLTLRKGERISTRQIGGVRWGKVGWRVGKGNWDPEVE